MKNQIKLQNEELNRISVDEFKATNKIPVKVVLNDIRSALNVGSVFRTSDAFLVGEIALCGITACPPNKEIRRTALGATDSVKWSYHKNCIDYIQFLKKDGYQILSIEQTNNSVLLNDFKIDKNQKYALVFGNEVKGVQQEIIDLSDNVIEIPQQGTKHSLNISVSTGIVLWDFFKGLN